MLLFTDSFDSYNDTEVDANRKWDWNRDAADNNIIQPGRTGANKIRMDDESGEVQKRVTSITDGELILGAAVSRPATITTFYGLSLLTVPNGYAHIVVHCDTSGIVYIRRESPTGAILAQSASGKWPTGWVYVEAKVYCHATTGYVVVRVNGDVVASVFNANTVHSSASASMTTIGLRGAVGGITDYDDVYGCDDTGEELNDFLGDVTVTSRVPNGNGLYSEFTPSTPGNHFELVDEAYPPVTSDKVTGTEEEKDSFQFTDLTDDGSEILAVVPSFYQAQTSAGIRKVAYFSRISSVDYFLDDLNGPPLGKYLQGMFLLNPATGFSWTHSELNSAEFGLMVKG